jgi:uncharacterized protein (DUF697 family)
MLQSIGSHLVNKVKDFYSQQVDPIKEQIRPELKPEEFSRLEAIIHTASGSAAAASGAMAQGAVVGMDTPVLITIHIGMIISLGEIFGRRLDKTTATALLGAAAGVGIGVFGVKAILGLIPIGGNIVNAAISFGYTEVLGWTFVKYFIGDKDTIQKFDLNMRGENMGDTYHVGQAGAVGKYSSSDGNTFIQSEQKKSLAQAAEEIQQLLKQLEKSNPTATEDEQISYVNDETSPSFKRRVAGALQAGGEAAIEEFLDNPYVNVGKAIVKGWLKPE